MKEQQMNKLQCGYCKIPFTRQSLFGHRVAKVDMGFVSIKVDYDLDCFSCGKQTTVRMHITSPLQVKGNRFTNM
jgi:5-methylcytosine-specific restriction endonuclease McrA